MLGRVYTWLLDANITIGCQLKAQTGSRRIAESHFQFVLKGSIDALDCFASMAIWSIPLSSLYSHSDFILPFSPFILYCLQLLVDAKKGEWLRVSVLIKEANAISVGLNQVYFGRKLSLPWNEWTLVIEVCTITHPFTHSPTQPPTHHFACLTLASRTQYFNGSTITMTRRRHRFGWSTRCLILWRGGGWRSLRLGWNRCGRSTMLPRRCT